MNRRQFNARRFYRSIGLPLEVRFWERVNKTDSCWVWIGSTVSNGYGQISAMEGRKQRFHYAHRLSYEWANGPISPGLCVCHHCDNPPCVRPDHLFLGTNRENTADAQRKGRIPTRQPYVPKPHIYRVGENVNTAKLTEELVRDIREEYALGLGSMGNLARIYGVDIANIHRIIHRQIWRHVA